MDCSICTRFATLEVGELSAKSKRNDQAATALEHRQRWKARYLDIKGDLGSATEVFKEIHIGVDHLAGMEG